MEQVKRNSIFFRILCDTKYVVVVIGDYIVQVLPMISSLIKVTNITNLATVGLADTPIKGEFLYFVF